MGDEDPNAKPRRALRFLRWLNWFIVYPICICLTAFVINEYRTWSARCEMQARAASWPESQGEVVATRVEKAFARRSYHFRPIIIYIYPTPQGPCSGSVMRFDDDQELPSRADAEAVTKRYPVGSPTTVRYDPDKTSVSALDASAPRWDVVHRIKIVLWLIAAAWLWFAVVQLRKIARWMRGQSLLGNLDHDPSPHIHKPK